MVKDAQALGALGPSSFTLVSHLLQNVSLLAFVPRGEQAEGASC